MRIIWNCLPYACIIAYIVFIFLSVRECNDGITEFYETPYTVSREVRQMRARLQTLRNALSFAFSNPEIRYADIEDMLAEHNKLQDASMDAIRSVFQDDRKGLVAQMFREIDNLREARLNVAKQTEDNTEPGEALAAYNNEIVPLLDRLSSVMLQISAEADDEGDAMRRDIIERHRMTEYAAILMGIFVCLLLFYNQMRSKMQRKAITHREKLFNLLSQTIDDVFLISDADAKMEYVSANSNRSLRLQAKKIARDPSVLYETLGKAGAWLKAELEDRSRCQIAEEDAQINDNRQKLKLQVYPVCDGKGRLERHIVVISDETETEARQQALKDALESARNANAAKSNFLASMSHEIRTPMNAIIGMATIAQNRINDKFRVENCLDKIQESSKHLLGLINDILDMSKVDSGKMVLNHEPFNLCKSIQSVISLIQAQAHSREQSFEVSTLGTEVESLVGDSLRLNQILVNLLGNAIKFTPPKGKISLAIETVEIKNNIAKLRFIVRDNGIGMSPEVMKRIYLPFEQGSRSASYGSAGLGLAITHNLVNLMDGAIAVNSEEGKGTEFRVDLPFALGETASECVENNILPELNVMVIDDDLGACEHACLILAKLGVKSESALDGESGIRMISEAKARGEPFDICLLDWKMPGMSGAETARRIRDVAGERIQIIIMSAFDWGAIEKEAREDGAVGFIAKPFFISSVYDALLSASEKIMPQEKEDEERYDFSGKRILLVEDNEFNREIAEEFLEMANAEVESAEDGKEAVEKFEASPPGYYDLALMDIQMPIMNGYDATRAIRKLKRPDAARVPILAMTANAFIDDVVASMEAGMNDHMAKPIEVRKLYKKLAQWLNATAAGKNAET